MSTMVLGGLGLTLVAGLLSGNCMLPMKFAKRWQWENVWLVFSMVSLVILPWTLALTLAGHLGEIYGALEPRQLALPFLLGAGWGIAQVLFGSRWRGWGSPWAMLSSSDWDRWAGRWCLCSSRIAGCWERRAARGSWRDWP